MFNIHFTGMTCDILQIAAVADDRVLNKYIIPSRPIPKAVQELTRITYSRGTLKSNGQAVEAVSQEEGISEFINFVCSMEKPIIVGHNIKAFDLPRLYDKCSDLEKVTFDTKVCAFLDTLMLFRGLYPDLGKHTQPFLIQSLLSETYAAHNALADVQALRKLVLKFTSQNQRKDYMYTPGDVMNQKDHDDVVAKNLVTISHLVGKGRALSTNMAHTIAASGLRYSHIALALKRGGVDGLAKVFREETQNGNPRVTKKGKAVAKKLAEVVQV